MLRAVLEQYQETLDNSEDSNAILRAQGGKRALLRFGQGLADIVLDVQLEEKVLKGELDGGDREVVERLG